MSAMGPEVLQSTIAALNASLSSKTTKAERDYSDQFIHNLKQSKECMMVIAHILGAATDDTITEFTKQLALTIFNDWIKIWWNKLEDNDKLAIKQHVLESLLLGGTLPLATNKGVRTKVAVIVCNIAERMFPQYWPNMVQELLQFWLQSDYSRQGVVIATFDSTISDCIDSDFNNMLPTLRRQEIVAGLIEHQQHLFHTSFEYLGFCLSGLRTVLTGSVLPISPAELALLFDSMQSLLNMLSSLASLVKVDELLDASSHDFIPYVVDIMCLGASAASNGILEQIQQQYSTAVAETLSRIHMHAAHLLLVITQQRMSVETFSRLLGALASAEVPVQQLQQQAERGQLDMEDVLQFQRRYALILHVLLSGFTSFVYNPNTAAGKGQTFWELAGPATAQEYLAQYLQRMIALLQLPSRKLACDVVKDWTKIYRDSALVQCDCFKQAAIAVLQEYMTKCRKPLWCEVPGLEADSTFEAEFEDHEEWNEFYGTFKSQVKQLAQQLTRHFPVLCADSMSQYLAQLIRREQQLPTSVGGAGTINSFSTFNSYSCSSKATLLECKSVLLELDIFHAVYGTLLKELLPPEPDPGSRGLTSGFSSEYSISSPIGGTGSLYPASGSTTTAGPGGPGGADGEVETSRKVLNSALQTLVLLLEWQPRDPDILMEQIRMIQYHSPALKRAPDYLIRAFSFLFNLILSQTPQQQQQQQGGSSWEGSSDTREDGSQQSVHQTRIAAHLSTLTLACAKEIVQSSFFQQFIEQVSAILTTVAHQGTKTSMRQSLMALSDQLGDRPALRVRALSLAVEDIIAQWGAAAPVVFASQEAFLLALLDRFDPSSSGSTSAPALPTTPTGAPTAAGFASSSFPGCAAGASEAGSGSKDAVLPYRAIKQQLDVMLLTTKRMTYPPLPNEVWGTAGPNHPDSGGSSISISTSSAPMMVSYEQFSSVFPFAPAWTQFLPHAFQAVGTLHGFWGMQMRQSLGSRASVAPASAAFNSFPTAEDSRNLLEEQILSAVYFPQKADVIRAAGIKSAAHQAAAAAADSSTVGKIAVEIKELRIFLYQILAQAASHKALYFHAEHGTFLQALSNDIPLMENAHVTILMRNLLEPYLLNALPMFYQDIAGFLTSFIASMLFRLSVASDRQTSGQGAVGRRARADDPMTSRQHPPTPQSTPTAAAAAADGIACPLQYASSAEGAFYWQVFANCSIPSSSDFAGLAREEVDNARDHVVADMCRAFCDVLGACLGMRGFLFTPNSHHIPSSSSGSSSSSSSSSNPSANSSNLSSAIFRAPSNDADLHAGGGAATSPTPTTTLDPQQAQLEQVKALRRNALQSLLLGTRFPALTQQFTRAAIALLCLPDAHACRFGVQCAQRLLDRCLEDQRFVVAVGKEAFSAALVVLLQQDKWSVGMEWDLVDFLLDAYIMLVYGEGRLPTCPAAGQSGIDNASAAGAATATAHTTAAVSGGGGRHFRQAKYTDWPQRILMSLEEVSEAQLLALEERLDSNMSKRKRRGFMKDFLAEVVTLRQQQGSGDTQRGSLLQQQQGTSTVGAVLDIRHRIMRSTKSRMESTAAMGGGGAFGNASDASNYNLNTLFDDL